jgi:glutamine synthetase
MGVAADRGALDAHRQLNAKALAAGQVGRGQPIVGVEFVYFQMVSLSGRVLGKVVPYSHFDRIAVRGVQLHRTAMADLQATRAGVLLGGGPQAAEFTAVPDLDTFDVLPWEPTFARVLCRMYEPSHLPDVGGMPLATDARGNLARVHAQFQEATGLQLRSGCEPEMTWTGEGLGAVMHPDSSPAYHVDHLERHREIVTRVIRYGQAMGLDMIEGDYEDPGQLELNWMFDVAELTADRLVTYRQICKQVAREVGVTASFMPKPATGVMGNGCHHNVSLWRGEVNVLEEAARTELHLTDIGRHALGGLLTHAAGSMAIMASTVNSYKRFWDAGQFAPAQINWGMDNKTCTVRLSANGRLEYKLPDASVNPYLSHAALIAAISDGITRQIDPGSPQSANSYESSDVTFDRIPLTLGDALATLERNQVVRAAFPEPMVETYLALKGDEWARFCGAVTDWERAYYANALP